MNKDLVKYVENAREKGFDDEAIAIQLKEVGWSEKAIERTLNGIPKISSLRWASVPSLVVGYMWLISGVNKILTSDFVTGFGAFTRGLVQNNSMFGWFRDILSYIVIPNASFFAQLIQYGEVVIGLGLLVGSLWSFSKPSRINQLVLIIAFLASTFLITILILSLGLNFPIVDTSNVFAAGVGLHYIILFTSMLMAAAHFEAWREMHN